MGVCLALEQANRKHIEATAQTVRQEAQFDMQLRELQHRMYHWITETLHPVKGNAKVPL